MHRMAYDHHNREADIIAGADSTAADAAAGDTARDDGDTVAVAVPLPRTRALGGGRAGGKAAARAAAEGTGVRVGAGYK